MKFYSNPIPEHEEIPLADDGQWEELVESWDEREEEPSDSNAVYVVSVGAEKDPRVRQAQAAEILALVRALGHDVVGHEILTLTKVRPRTLLGKGTARTVADRARSLGAAMLILDAELSPSQTRNLEDDAGIKVCDREAVILNVFLKHARTRRSRIQIEIAQLEYLRPRIRGVGIDMDQQMGGVAGSRGPGETASELLARQLDDRLAELRKVQKRLSLAGQNQRTRRDKCQKIALVGYTNAGKTSLMNALTGESLSSKDSPFETLDTVSRSLSRHGERVLLSDTVGFIRRLPERLLESFETTLAEVREATLLALVVDVADYEWKVHLQTTLELLQRLGAGDIKKFFVFNKIDLVQPAPDVAALSEVAGESPFALVSSRDEDSVARLRESLLTEVRQEQEERTLFVPYADSRTLNLIYGGCRVSRTEPREDGVLLTFQGPKAVVGRIEDSQGEEVTV